MRRPIPNSSPTTPEEVIALFLDAYRQGAFPMAELPGNIPANAPLPTAHAIHWYRPDPRAILPLDDGALRIPRSIQRTLAHARFTLTLDHDFEGVIRACARPTPSRGGPWLDESLVRVYTLLHRAGHAHSIEAWSAVPRDVVALDDSPCGTANAPASPTLLGGIYGLSIGSAFFAESMFSDIERGGTGASSACLVALWHHLRARGYTLLDVQIANEHTLRFGVQEIPLDEYLERLDFAVANPNAWQ